MGTIFSVAERIMHEADNLYEVTEEIRNAWRSDYVFLLITNLTHVFMYLFHPSACFEHHSAHHQKIELY
jgi:hypothetical protein